MKILLFIRSYSSHTRIVPYGIQRSSVAVVREYGLHHYQPTRNFMRGRTLKYPLKPLLLLHFVMPSTFLFFIISLQI